MKRVVFDIETVGAELSSLPQATQEYFLRQPSYGGGGPQGIALSAPPEAERIKEAQDSLNFYPLTAQVVAVAMLEVETESGFVFFQNESAIKESWNQDGVLFSSGSEPEILESFWKQLRRYDQFVTFNGRLFDGPFLMLRSAMHRLRTTCHLVPYRYSANQHVDLADQLTFYDALRRRFPLSIWCQAFGIPDPKAEGISGLQVRELFGARRYADIARYCLNDVRATKALFDYWDKYLKF